MRCRDGWGVGLGEIGALACAAEMKGRGGDAGATATVAAAAGLSLCLELISWLSSASSPRTHVSETWKGGSLSFTFCRFYFFGSDE